MPGHPAWEEILTTLNRGVVQTSHSGGFGFAFPEGGIARQAPMLNQIWRMCGEIMLDVQVIARVAVLLRRK